MGPQWFCGYATLELKNIYTTLVLKNIMLIKVTVKFSIFDNLHNHLIDMILGLVC